jgi:hypothetical protein
VKLKTYNHKGDLDELLNSGDDEDEVDTLELFDLNKFKGRIEEYDNDYLSHSLLMENNPLDTFSKNYHND